MKQPTHWKEGGGLLSGLTSLGYVARATSDPEVPATVAVTYPCTDKGGGTRTGEGRGEDPRECLADEPQRRADAPQPGRPRTTDAGSLSAQRGRGAHWCNTGTSVRTGPCYVAVPIGRGWLLVDLAVDGILPATSAGLIAGVAPIGGIAVHWNALKTGRPRTAEGISGSGGRYWARAQLCTILGPVVRPPTCVIRSEPPLRVIASSLECRSHHPLNCQPTRPALAELGAACCINETWCDE
jgi:hypothetical protein